jgi:hypothetical protein
MAIHPLATLLCAKEGFNFWIRMLTQHINPVIGANLTPIQEHHGIGNMAR